LPAQDARPVNWKSYLRVQTRNPQFLWRVVLAILAAGGVAAIGVGVLVYEPPRSVLGDEMLTTGGPRDILSAEPEPEPPALQRLFEAQRAHAWWTVWWLIPRVAWVEIDVGSAAIAALTALFWLVFVLQAGEAESPRTSRFWLCVAGLPLGALSTWPTLFVVAWQDEMWGLVSPEEQDLLASLRYFIVGVGVREELLKLAFFLPLVPFVLARRNELERLVVASCVGLGFAAEENIGYFGRAATDSVGRYLTANFWHLASTGLAGLWLCRAIRWPKECLPQFLAYFGLIVVGHGVYDAFIGAGDYSIVTSIVFLGLAYAYFHELRGLRPRRNEVVSLTANFVVGVSLLAAITFVYVTAHLGLRGAGQAYLQPTISASLMAYVFLREVPESLVRT
jgi:RsiW-degrading membrane proteinase PrsW (M82 family)